MIIEGDTVKCECGFIMFDGMVLRVRVGLFSGDYMTLKRKRCKRWTDGIPVGLLTGKIKFGGDGNGGKADSYQEHLKGSIS